MSNIMRNKPRKISITPDINPYAPGSAMIEFGNTKVHVTVTIEEGVPSFMKGQGTGWLTAEYSMLPSSTHTRVKRERREVKGRTMEIQRLIGRSLRAIIDLNKIGERTVIIDCDVLVADGGTRTAAISGAYVALYLALKRLHGEGQLTQFPLTDSIGAISVGISTEDKILVDLNYEEDSTCSADFNLVMTGSGKFIEVQGTAEGVPFSLEQFESVLKAGKSALEEVTTAQKKVLAL
jgi:ribonuclease PH